MARKKYQTRAKRPYLFEIDGVDFDTVRRIPGASFVDFIRQLDNIQSDESRTLSDVGQLGDTIHEMFESVMEPEEFSRFWKWARSPDGPDFDVLVDILSDMVADDSDRPTGRPSRSGRGPQKTGANSTESS